MLEFFVNFILFIFKIMLYIVVGGIAIIYYIIKGIIKLIKRSKDKRSFNSYEHESANSQTSTNYNSVVNPTFTPKVDKKGDASYDYSDLSREYHYIKYDDYNSAKINNLITHKEKEITNIEKSNYKEYKNVNIKLYLNKNNKNLTSNDELKTKLLNISPDECFLLVVDESDKYLILTDEADTFIYYPKIINKILNYCKDDSYFIIGHDNKEEYKYIFKDNQILLKDYDEQKLKEEYLKLKNSILETTKLITKYTLKIKSDYNVIPYNNHSLEWDDLTKVINKLKSNKLSNITELPYLNEIDSILKSSLPKLKEEYDKYIPQEITNSKQEDKYYNLNIYISKYYSEIIKDDELNCKKIGLDNIDLCDIYADDSANYIEISLSEYTAKDYSHLLKSLSEYCGNDMYAIYNHKDITYKFTIEDSKCYINNYSYIETKAKYDRLKNEIINIIDILNDKLTFIEGNYDYNILSENGDFDDYEELANTLRDNKEVSIFELPYMEEATSNLKILETKVNKIYVAERNQGLHDFYYEEKINDEEDEKPDIKPSKKEVKPKKKELTEAEKRFEKEADYFGLTKREREICKLENMTPEEFDEAEDGIDPLRDDEL